MSWAHVYYKQRFAAADYVKVAATELRFTPEELDSVRSTRRRLLLKAQQLLSPLRRTTQRTLSSYKNVLVTILESQSGAKAQ